MRLALIGVGLIGGSFALATRAGGKFDRVVGFDTEVEALRRAENIGIIDEAASTAAGAVSGAGLVLIATPVGSIQQVLHEVAPHVSSAAIITDVGSTKGSVIEGARHELGAAFARFIPGHPIAGRERSGVAYADAALFRDKLFVTTPARQTSEDALRTVEALWRDAGCRIERMTPEEHDDVFAAVSHLPHLLAFALVAQIAAGPDSARRFAMSGAGFRDFTRIAASSPQMWSDICVANRVALGQRLREQRGLLEELQRAVDAGDAAALQRVFSMASDACARSL